MAGHLVFREGKVAVITGAGDGIGLACARKLASFGMKVCLADVEEARLAEAVESVDGAMGVLTDVSSREDVERLKQEVFSAFGAVDFLMNNAGTARGGEPWTSYEEWQTTLNVNLWGPIHGVHAFVPSMIERGEPALVVNTGSKQGITCPPGNPSYNVSKAGVKAFTEALEHSLRNVDGCRVRAHLLVPGFTYSGMIRQFLPDKPDAAWTTEQVADFMVERIDAGDFYILCPDNDVSREMDNKRMEWAMGDLIHNRPPLSRWHPDYEAEFAKFMEE